MTVLYEAYQSTMANKEKKLLYYPRVVRVGNVSTDQVAREVAEYSSLSPGDVKNALDNLVTVLTRHLQASESVTLDGLGTFRLTMRSAGRGVEKAESVSASQASLMVRFTPAFTRDPNGRTATRSMLTGARCKRFDLANDPTAPEEPAGPAKPTVPEKPGGEDDGGKCYFLPPPPASCLNV